MAIQFQLVRAVLVGEIASFIVLLAPLRNQWRKRAMHWITQSAALANLRYLLRIIFVFILILFFGKEASCLDSKTR